MPRSFFSLATRIVALVVFMGSAALALLLLAAQHIQRTEVLYHALLEQQSATTVHLQMARRALVDARNLLAVRAQSDVTSSDPQPNWALLQRTFQSHWQPLYALLPSHTSTLDQLSTQAHASLQHGQLLLQQLHQPSSALAVTQFVHTHEQVLGEIDHLQHKVHSHLQAAAQQALRQTQRAIQQTWWIGVLCVLLVTGGALYLSVQHISLPIQRLTRSMQRIREHDYSTPIEDQTRRDEIGVMASTLHSFLDSLQRSQQLQREHADSEQQQAWMQQLTQLTSGLPGPVFQLRLQGEQSFELIFISPQWHKLLGLTDGEPASLTDAAQHLTRHHPDLYASALKHFLHSAHTLQPLDFDMAWPMPDGVQRWIKTNATPVRQADGSTLFNGLLLDVTKEATQSLALEKAKRQAEQTSQEKSTLQASISHEIRTPLNAILGLTQLLLKAELPAAQHEQLQSILRASQHLRGIVNEVLDFSKLDAGQMQLESTDFSLHDVVQDVLSMCKDDAQRKGLVLGHHVASRIPDSLRGDPHRIAQILLNYVNNAIKFTASGSIHIAVDLAANSTLHRIVLHVSVTDTGPGIPADRVPLLFQAFQQADNSITRRYGGTGLGLTISRALAQLMGGQAGVDTQFGQGSTFWFTAVLEPARTPVQSAYSYTRPTAPPHWQGLRVLVVDDNALNRAVAQGMLHAAGLLTDTAEDGEDALHKLKTAGANYYQCVLMDVQMPRMDGLSATRALRQWPEFAKLPVIAMTAHSSVEDRRHTQHAGMSDHLCKPLLESALQQALHQWLPNPIDAVPPTAAPAIAPEPEPEMPDVFAPHAIDALTQLFAPDKLQQLIDQFVADTSQRAQGLPALAAQHDWLGMRAETHKLTGTAATFGLERLGHLSAQLSAALKGGDTQQTTALANAVAQTAQEGIEQLLRYCRTSAT